MTTKQKDPLLYGVIGVLIGGVIVWFLTSNAVNNNQAGMMAMMGIRQMTGQTNQQGVIDMMGNIDRHFIEQMIPHHEDAITMANLALENAKRPEIKTLALDIIKAQGEEISKMNGWYKEWFGTDAPENSAVMGQHGMVASGGMHMGMMGTQEDVASLENAEDFDTAFIEHMILHHQMAVMMATMLKNSTQRQEMDKLADDIIIAQTNEIDQMREWLKSWSK
jgi:uncharacterized protein (DUF305 family)